jgi:hypothetical protein
LTIPLPRHENSWEFEVEPDSTTRLRLQGQDTTFVIGAAAWRELVEIASKKGWQSEHAPACYWADVGLEVTARDARRLSQSFEALGDDLVNSVDQYLDEDVSQLVADLGELLVFCRAGGFRIG